MYRINEKKKSAEQSVKQKSAAGPAQSSPREQESRTTTGLNATQRKEVVTTAGISKAKS